MHNLCSLSVGAFGYFTAFVLMAYATKVNQSYDDLKKSY